LRLAGFLGLTEQQFARVMHDVESDPLFRRLFAPPDARCRVISHKRFKGTRFLLHFALLNEAVSPDPGGMDIEALVRRHPDVIPLIRRIGRENFEKYFVYNDDVLSATAIGAACGIAAEEVLRIHRLMDDVSLQGEFFHPSTVAAPGGLPCCRIASIDRDGIIHFYSPQFARGAYAVDYERLKELRQNGYFSANELAALNPLLSKIRLLNARKATIARVIEKIAEKQRAYLLSGEEKDLVAFTQRELARALGVSDSLVSRALFRRSIGFLDEREQPLSFFFPNRKEIRKTLIRRILQERGGVVSDRTIRDILKDEFCIVVARRTVNSCRNELLH
jgi:hypothetical protein